MSSSSGNIEVMVGAYRTSEIDVCAALNAGQQPELAQFLIRINPDLDQLPQTLTVGIPGVTTNAGSQVFLGDPTSEFTDMLWGTDGTVTYNSLIEGEKAKLTELFIGELGTVSEDSNGNITGYETVEGYVQVGASTDEIVACYCEGLIEFYANLVE